MKHVSRNRSNHRHCFVALLGLALAAPAAFGQGRSFHNEVNKSFGLERSDIITLDVNVSRSDGLLTFVPIEGLPTFLDLKAHSVRGDNYQVLVQQADGSLVEALPGPERTLRGEVIGMDGAKVAGSMLDDGLHATIRLPDGSSYWLEPIGKRVAGAGINQHVLYHNEDVIFDARVCGTNDMMRIKGEAPGLIKQDGGSSTIEKAAAAFCTAELACDADFEYSQTWGSVANVEARINSVINAVNVQYERDVAITHVITTIIVRTSEPDPYSSTDAVTLLNQFRTQWLNNHAGVQRDMAQLFTGKEVDSNTIGIAWLNAVCTTNGFSVVQSDFNGTGSFACTTDLSAHEMGHNWGADHCGCSNPRGSYTMNSFITCANQFHPRRTIPEIISFRDSRSCLDSCGGGDPPDPTGCTGTTAVASHTCGPGAKRNDCLIIDIAITCDGAPLSGATVAVQLDGNTGDTLTGSATTDGNGEVSFKLRCNQAASSSYISTVTAIDGVSTNVGGTNVQITGCDI